MSSQKTTDGPSGVDPDMGTREHPSSADALEAWREKQEQPEANFCYEDWVGRLLADPLLVAVPEVSALKEACDDLEKPLNAYTFALGITALCRAIYEVAYWASSIDANLNKGRRRGTANKESLVDQLLQKAVIAQAVRLVDASEPGSSAYSCEALDHLPPPYDPLSHGGSLDDEGPATPKRATRRGKHQRG